MPRNPPHKKCDSVSIGFGRSGLRKKDLAFRAKHFASLVWRSFRSCCNQEIGVRGPLRPDESVTREVELCDLGDRCRISSDGGTRDGLETVDPVCAAG